MSIPAGSITPEQPKNKRPFLSKLAWFSELSHTKKALTVGFGTLIFITLVTLVSMSLASINSNSNQPIVKTTEQIQAEQKAQAEAELQAQAEQAAFEKTKAGQICKQNPTWTKNDCQRVANNEIWIGMDAFMLKAERGSPNHTNKSNYGSGEEWQFCWDDYMPSCFYTNSDGIVYSYN